MIKAIDINSNKSTYNSLTQIAPKQQVVSPTSSFLTYPSSSTLRGYYLAKLPQKTSFSGTPQRLPNRTIYGASDAIAQWDLLRFAKYSDVHDDAFASSNKQIRLDNYSFLDKLSSDYDKRRFIDHFKQVTGFPDLKKVSENMSRHFSNTIYDAASDIYDKNAYHGWRSNPRILFYGFDPTCSTSLEKSFPGSDLDKAYIIINGEYPLFGERGECVCTMSDNETVNRFKGNLWNKRDQRLVSVNHRDTFPEVITMNQFKKNLDFLDKKAKELIQEKGKETYLKLRDSDIKEPILAAKFNIDLAKKLDKYPYNGTSKEEAKNFAFLIETLRADPSFEYTSKEMEFGSPSTTDDVGMYTIVDWCKNSPFFELSNVTQAQAWKKQLGTGYRKQKLRNREEIERNFNNWSTNDQYELVKDIIKASSDDHSNNKFDKYFQNDDDIKERFTPLIDALTK